MVDVSRQRSDVSLRAAIERLPAAELDFAHFNAQRTTAAVDGAGIVRGATSQFAFLLDAGRPSSSYYNRAVARAADAISAAALDELPAGVVAIETQPAALTLDASKLLLAHGFAPQYQLCYLAAAPDSAPPTGVTVERLGPEQVDMFLDLLGHEGVTFDAARRGAKRRYYCTDQFRAYVARAGDGAVAGWATMFVGEGFVFFGNAYTLPAARRSGAHGALLAARLADAATLRAAVAYTDVEHQSQSHLNCERAGFRTLSINTIWVRPA